MAYPLCMHRITVLLATRHDRDQQMERDMSPSVNGRRSGVWEKWFANMPAIVSVSLCPQTVALSCQLDLTHRSSGSSCPNYVGAHARIEVSVFSVEYRPCHGSEGKKRPPSITISTHCTWACITWHIRTKQSCVLHVFALKESDTHVQSTVASYHRLRGMRLSWL